LVEDTLQRREPCCRTIGEKHWIEVLDGGPTGRLQVTLGIVHVRKKLRVVPVQPGKTAVARTDSCKYSHARE